MRIIGTRIYVLNTEGLVVLGLALSLLCGGAYVVI